MVSSAGGQLAGLGLLGGATLDLSSGAWDRASKWTRRAVEDPDGDRWIVPTNGATL